LLHTVYISFGLKGMKNARILEKLKLCMCFTLVAKLCIGLIMAALLVTTRM
jgi:hypothetical protein